ncbi:hypothetical protein [Nonomuraea basaltis]|uniref:hypothetical protein n=1 Tax=Nonomuraea basaltis TaxID=2495887 RepID=UPI00110C5405|nr:hypothetical protein [Nonomuraea basaltis]TMR93961.1 hypothetical protein EJK15_36255 [Nonomuraea basaltis]
MASVYDVLHAELQSTGVSADSLGTKQDLYLLHQQAVDAAQTEAPAEPRASPSPPPVSTPEACTPEASGGLPPGTALTIPPPVPSPDACTSLSPAPAMPLDGLDTLPQPNGPADKPWPASQDIPSGPMPSTDQPAPNPAPRGTENLATPDLARHTQHRPDPSRRLKDDTQPVEKEAALALMGSSPPRTGRSGSHAQLVRPARPRTSQRLR